jgi:hypothetical protein
MPQQVAGRKDSQSGPCPSYHGDCPIQPELDPLTLTAAAIAAGPIAGGFGAAAGAAEESAGEYLASKAPMQVTPGTTQLQGQYVSDIGRVEPWTASYDEYGRIIARTDYNAGNAAEGIPSTHYHTYSYGPGTPGGMQTGAHIPGVYPGTHP